MVSNLSSHSTYTQTEPVPDGTGSVWYDGGMKLLQLSILFLCLGAIPAHAYNLTVTEVDEPFEIVEVGEYDEGSRLFLGELEQYPVMYEFTVSGEREFAAELRQQYSPEPIPFGLILIRENDNGRGVSEVIRLNPATEDWVQEKDRQLGMTFWRGPVMSQAIATGTYRLEVSTPDNESKYGLSIGLGESEAGYFATLGNIRTTQAFFGFSFLKILTSSYVYLPLGILALLFGIQRTWKYRKTIAHVE